MEQQTGAHSEKESSNFLSRRYFLEAIGGGAIALTTVGSIVLTVEFLSPNVLREPPFEFTAGPLDEFPPDSVTTNKEQKVFIIRAKEGYLYTLSTICTHLGCITNWKSDEGIITCPCHGSKFDREGKVIEGPAPRPLPRYLITMGDEGKLIVDKAQIVGDEVILKA